MRKVVAIWIAALCAVASGCQAFDVSSVDHGIYAQCCEGIGACLPAALIAPSQAGQIAQDSCAEALLCVPLEAIELERYRAPSCRSLGDGEGRCLPACLPEVAAQAERLPQADCAAHHLCAPCFDPLTGEATDACHIGADPGPTQPPVVFAQCCEGEGRCVPNALVPDADRERLGIDDCANDRSELCVPEPWLQDEPVVPMSCRSLSDGEGRCLPACLPEVAAQAERLPQADCPAHYLCAPCFDPLTGEATDACHIGADPGPTQSPVVFAQCCEGEGRCVPNALVPDADRERLGIDDCANDRSELCVPEPWLQDEPVVPMSCRSLSDGEGRCLPACLPEVAAQAERLPQADCPEHHLCAPCFDPISGEATDACHIGADPGPTQPPVVFAQCCEGEGRCVPNALVPDADRERLGVDDCANDGEELCVPEPWLQDEPVVPMSCRSLGDGEGRCLPACLPELTAQAERLPQGDCPEHHLCAPCFDPISGEATDACHIGADPGPTQSPVVFAQCCEGEGRCVPNALVPDADRERLGVDDCANDREELCVPEPWLQDEPVVPMSCRSLSDGEGRCLPACLPEVAAQAERLPQADCPEHHLCAPCFDPNSGEATGACHIGADPGPTQPPTVFAQCCEGEGRCVPNALVPDADRERLGVDDCANDREELCVPEPWLQDEPVVPMSCRSLGDGEGRCLPACLPELTAQAERLPQGDCPEHHLCAPCFDPLSGEATGACHIGADPGPTQPPFLFSTCCLQQETPLGVCIPDALISADDLALLPSGLCNEPDTHCVPDTLAREGKLVSCVTLALTPGACVPECLIPTVQASLLSVSTCTTGERCVPCSQLNGTCE